MKNVGVSIGSIMAVAFLCAAVCLIWKADGYLPLMGVFFAGEAADFARTAWEIATGRRIYRYSKDVTAQVPSNQRSTVRG